jgi:Lrp/AsnC family leucine-responsive transcriptional regulator
VSQPHEEIDSVDLLIIDSLQEDARRTLGDIGTKVGLSAPAVKRRIDRLERIRVITGYSVRLDHSKLGKPLEAFTEVRFTGSERVDSIAGIADDIPEVVAVFITAGDPDAVVWIRVADVQHLKRVVDRLRASGKVMGTKTLIVLGTSPQHLISQ